MLAFDKITRERPSLPTTHFISSVEFVSMS